MTRLTYNYTILILRYVVFLKTCNMFCEESLVTVVTIFDAKVYSAAQISQKYIHEKYLCITALEAIYCSKSTINLTSPLQLQNILRKCSSDINPLQNSYLFADRVTICRFGTTWPYRQLLKIFNQLKLSLKCT